MDLLACTVHQMKKMLDSGEVTSVELVKACLERIKQKDESIRAFITVDEDNALAAAARSDQRRKEDDLLSPWDGVPVAVKDNISTKGMKTTCGSKILHNYVPPYDSTVVERLRQAGLPLIGKTNMDEFAMGSSTEHSAFFPTANPVDPTRVPGGSSGGSAAAVAALEVPWALGSDTGGSIRQPASFCGVVGIKPTYGRVSRYGLVAFASSLDQIGPLARSAADAAALLEVISGFDPQDSTSVDTPVPDLQAAVQQGVAGLKIGLPREYFADGLDPAVKGAVMAAADHLAEQGAEVVEVSIPSTEYAIETYYLIATAEASSNLARYDGVRYGYRAAGDDTTSMFENTRSQGFGSEVKRRIMLGTYVLSAGYYDAYYKRAQQVRTIMRRDLAAVLEKVDLLLTPTTPTTAFCFGEKEDPMQMYLQDIYTVTVNLAGVPALSLPCGRDAQGLPIGAQLIGRHFAEETLIRAAAALERTEVGGKQIEQI